MKKIQGILLFISIYLFSQIAVAEKTKALAWLNEQNQPNGAISLDTDVANIDQSTSEAIAALSELPSSEIESKITDGLVFLTDSELSQKSTESLSRILSLKVLLDKSYDAELTELLKRRDPQGGFSDFVGESPTILSTAFALNSLSKTSYPVDSESVGYLISLQSSGGAWLFPTKGDPSVALTAYSMDALWQYRNQLSISSNLSLAQSYLESQKQASSKLWSGVEDSALALISIAQNSIDRSSINDSIAALIAMQKSNGSFENDVYQTALVVRLLQVLEKPALDAIQVTGTVLDADSGSVLPNVGIKLSGAESFEAVTDVAGKFVISPSSAGKYVLTISLKGYSEVVFNTTLVKGNQLSIGDIALNKLAIDPETGEPNLTGTVRGNIKSRLTNAPLEGVVVSINGQAALTSVTDANGDYQISNVDPGSINISAALTGFQTVNGSAELLERQTLVFSPFLTKALSDNVSISGTVTDNESGQPLESVAIVAIQNGNQYRVTSGVDGRYLINDVPKGVIEISASLAGYVSVSGSVDAPAGANVSFSPTLVLEGNPPVNDQASIKGLIVDSASGRGLDGVVLTITYTSSGQTLTFNTDADGNVDIPDLDIGEVSLEATLPGYRSQVVTLDLQSGFGIDLGTVELQPDVPQVTADVSGRLIDVRTNQVVSNGIVSFSNNGVLVREVMSDANGLFTANMIDLGDVTISISRQGYQATEFVTNLGNPTDIDLGDIRLRPEGVNKLLPDLTLLSIDTSGTTSDGQTLNINGTLAFEFANRGNSIAAGGYRIVAFDDVNNDGMFDVGDTVLGESNYDQPIAVEEVVKLTISVSGIQRFRDAPVSVVIDASNFVTELSEDNNVDQSQGECSRQANVNVDLALCLDSSGSVSGSEFNLQLEGTARALENPDIVARDGSVRATVIQFASSSKVELVPTVITEGNIESVVEQIRTIRKRGGGTSIHSCIDAARNQIVSANDISPSLAQVIDVSTDGQSNQSAAIAASNRAKDAEIDVLNSIGIGSGVDINLLNSIVFPQPVGGERGFVVTTRNFQEYIDAISVKIAKETKVVDLTAGKLELTTSADQVSLSVIVGNSGSGDISETVIVRFYDGDPAQGGIEVGSVEHQAGIVSGGHLKLSINGLTASQINAGKVFAVADFVNSVAECTLGNNQTSVEVKSSSGTIDLAIDKTIYSADESIQFVSTVTNTGLFAGVYKVDSIIKDVSGNDVAQFSNQATGNIEPSTSKELSGLWSVGNSLAGSYTIESLLYDFTGKVIDRDQKSFTIVSDSQVVVSIRTNTDRSKYNTNDLVGISDLVRNLSTNAIQPSAQLLVTVSNPSGVEVYQNNSSLGDLSPSFSKLFSELFQLNNADLGIYTVTGKILDGNGKLLATDTTQFSVGLVLDAAITGDVVVSSDQVFQGQTLQCSDKIINTTTTDIGDLKLRQLVVDIDSEQVVVSDESSIVLGGNTDLNLNRDVNTSGYKIGNYACALQAFVDNKWITLDSEFFEVLDPPIKIELTAEIGDKGRVLVLLDNSEQCTDDPYGPYNSPDLVTQQAFLEDVLSKAGWSYTITLNDQDFVREMRTGGYSNYLLLAEIERLSHFTQKELREAVYRGEGLIEAGKRVQPHEVVNSALGIRYRGIERRAQGFTLNDSELGSADSLLFTHRDNNIRVAVRSAQLVAEYMNAQRKEFEHRLDRHSHEFDNVHNHNPNWCPPIGRTSPAITFNKFGLGKTVYMGFDLLSEAASFGDVNNAYTELLLNALNVVDPEPTLTTIGTDYPIVLTVSNLGSATPATLVLPIPENVSIVDVGEGVINSDSKSVSWALDLSKADVTQITVWVEMPNENTILNARVVTSEDDNQIERANASIELIPEVAINIDDVIESASQARSLNSVSHHLKYARWYQNKGRFEYALRSLLLAANHVAKIQRYYQDEDLSALRINIDLLIKQTAQKVVVHSKRRRCKLRGSWEGYHYPKYPRSCRTNYWNGYEYKFGTHKEINQNQESEAK